MMALVASSFSTPNKVNKGGGSRTPGSSDRKRDALVKVTFCVHHDVSSVEDGCMHVVGSLPSLGCWDHKKARKMAAGSDGTYTLAVYIPEKVDFLYQYLMVIGSETGPGTVVWEGAVERKCRVEEACSTPGRRLLLEDDVRGETSGPAFPTADSRSEVADLHHLQQAELDTLLKERGRCQVCQSPASTCSARPSAPSAKTADRIQ
jgi:hypothetical protein